MKFSCNTADILQGIQLVGRAISGQQALPILGNILIEAEGKRCTLSATDLEVSIVTSIPASIENEGAITVPSKAILNFAQYNSDKEVLFETSEGTQLKCTSTHTKTMIAGEASTEYPSISPIQKETEFTLAVDPLLEALHKVTFASAKTTLRPVLSGVYVQIQKGNLIMVATDSYRLSEYTLRVDVDSPEAIACIIPTKVLEELRAILSSKKSETDTGDEKKKSSTISIALGAQQIEVRSGQTRLLSRLIDGTFPDYKQIIPKEDKTTISLSHRELITAVKRMHYFAKEMNNNLTFSVSNNGVHITTPQTQAGRDETTLQADIKGSPNKIALSSSYLLDLLGHMDGDTIEAHITDSMHPAVFRTPGNAQYLHLIMPLRIPEE